MTAERVTLKNSSSLVIPATNAGTTIRISGAKQQQQQQPIVTMSNGTNHIKGQVKKSAPFSPSSRGSAMLKAALDHKATNDNNNSSKTTSLPTFTVISNTNKDDHNNNIKRDNNSEQTNMPAPEPTPQIANGFHNLNQQYLSKTINLFTGCANNNSTYSVGSRRKPAVNQRTRTGILGSQVNRTYKTTRPRSERVLFTNPLVSKKFEYEPTIYPIEQTRNSYRSSLAKDQNSSTDNSDGEGGQVDDDEDEEDILDIILNKSDEQQEKVSNNTGKQPKQKSLYSSSKPSPRRRSLKRPLSQVPHVFSPAAAASNELANSDSSDSGQSNSDDLSLFSPPKVAKIAPFYHLPGIIRKISDQAPDDTNSDNTDSQQRDNSSHDGSASEDVPQVEENCNTICATVQTTRNNNSFLYNIIAGGCNFITSRLSRLIY